MAMVLIGVTPAHATSSLQGATGANAFVLSDSVLLSAGLSPASASSAVVPVAVASTSALTAGATATSTAPAWLSPAATAVAATGITGAWFYSLTGVENDAAVQLPGTTVPSYNSTAGGLYYWNKESGNCTVPGPTATNTQLTFSCSGFVAYQPLTVTRICYTSFSQPGRTTYSATTNYPATVAHINITGATLALPDGMFGQCLSTENYSRVLLSGVGPGSTVVSAVISATRVPPPPPATTYPDKWVEQTIQCNKADGSSYTLSQTYYANASGNISIAGLSCNSGDFLTDASTELTDGTTSEPLSEPYAAPPAIDLIPHTCAVAGAQCVYEIIKINPTTGTRLNCLENPAACLDFQPTTGTVPNTYQCFYGGQVVDMRLCSGFVFDTDPSGTPTVTRVPTPELAEPLPTTPTETVTDDGSCSLGWGDVLNGSVVYKAVKCALTWAFVPSPASVQLATAQLRASMESSAIGTAVSVADDFVSPVVAWADLPSANCLGPGVGPMDIGPTDIPRFYPFQACSGVSQWLNTYWMPIASLLVYVASLTIGANLILRTLGIVSAYQTDLERDTGKGKP